MNTGECFIRLPTISSDVPEDLRGEPEMVHSVTGVVVAEMIDSEWVPADWSEVCGV